MQEEAENIEYICDYQVDFREIKDERCKESNIEEQSYEESKLRYYLTCNNHALR